MNATAVDFLAPEDQARVVETDEPTNAARSLARPSIPKTTERTSHTSNQGSLSKPTATWARTENLVQLKMPEAPRRPHASAAQTELLQSWEGVVQEVDGDEFIARLSDLTDPSREREVGTFDLGEVSDDDLPLVVPGAVFYWNIGYSVALHGQRTRFSTLRFRRLPAWSANDIRRLKEATLYDDVFSNDAAE